MFPSFALLARFLTFCVSSKSDSTEKLDPSDDVYKNKELVTSLYRSLSADGVISIQVGSASDLKDHPLMQAKDDHMLDLLELLEEVGFESIIDYDESQGRFAAPWSFLAIMKNERSRVNWFVNDADVSLTMRSRARKTKNGASPFHYFDGATMMSYKFPTRIQEELWCRRGPTPEKCRGHGYDPERQNFPASSFEVKTKASGAATGQVVLAKEKIPKGSYVELDECVNRMYISPSTYGLLFQMAGSNLRYWVTLAYGLVGGFGSVSIKYVSLKRFQ